jgi:hypothetical protein
MPFEATDEIENERPPQDGTPSGRFCLALGTMLAVISVTGFTAARMPRASRPATVGLAASSVWIGAMRGFTG